MALHASLQPQPNVATSIRAGHLINELAAAEAFPEATIRACLEHGDEVVPGFLRFLQHYADNPDFHDDRAEALFFIVHILGELGEVRSFAPLIDFLVGDQRRAEEILSDAITENLAQILIGVFDGDVDRLYRVMNDPKVDEFIRAAAFLAWTHAVAAGSIAGDEAERYLAGCFDDLEPQSESYVWVAWLDAISYLGFEALLGLVRQAFDSGRVTRHAIAFEDFEDALGARLAAGDVMAFLRDRRVHPFTGTIETLSRWYAFSDDFLRAKRQARRAARSSLNANNPYRGVGRNHPCPCGSGKKFKKCCLSGAGRHDPGDGHGPTRSP